MMRWWLAATVVNQMIAGLLRAGYVQLSGVIAACAADGRAVHRGVDEKLGFDWLAFIGWVNAHPLVARVFTFCCYDWHGA